MSRSSSLTGIIFVAMAAAAAAGAYAADTTEDVLRGHVETLTRPEMEGRRVGSQGHDRARDYIAQRFEEVGLEPAGEDGWFTSTEVVWDVESGRSTELTIDELLLARGVEFQPLGFSDDEPVSGELAFVGCGISDPHGGWDDYADVSVEGKIAIALTDGPLTPELSPSQLTDDAKAATALAKGATGFLLVNAPRTYGDRPDQRPDELGPMRPSEPLEGLAAGKLTRRAGTKVFEQLGLDLDSLQAKMDGTGRSAAQSLGARLTASMTMEVVRQRASVDNVLGRVPTAEDVRPTGAPIFVGAHYDHLGEGITGSLWDGEAMLHPGADDNASGVAVIIEVARRLSRAQRSRPVYIVATTAEEVGLRGARRLASKLSSESRGTYINLDMVGRLRDPGLRVLGLERTRRYASAFDTAASAANIDLVRGDLYDSPSDHIAFAEAGFEALHLTTGRHTDYHRPTDRIDALNFDGMQRVTQFVTLVVQSLAE